MLIIVSDLHLMDGSSGQHYLGVDVFQRIFRDLGTKAREAGAKDIKIVFLGDIFDLIRTEQWFTIDPEERPWGGTPPWRR